MFPRRKIGMNAPFRLIEGRFNVSNCLRPLSWAIEWVRPETDLVIKRGEPWFDITFATENIDDNFVLEKSELTEAQLKLLQANKDVTSYIKGTKSLMSR